MFRRRIFPIILACLFLAIAHDCAAQAALNAPSEDSIYGAIDVLSAHGLADDVVVGQRPYSRLEIARILKVARSRLESQKGADDVSTWEGSARSISRYSHLNKLIAFYEAEHRREMDGMKGIVEFDALERFDLTMLYNGSAPRPIPSNNGQGSIDGIVTSFDRYGQGLTFAHGANSFVSTRHNLYVTPYLAFTAQPRFEFFFPGNGDDGAFAHLHRLYAKGGWKNIELEVGRDNILWGQGEDGGLMLSANARPLDMAKISNPYPWRMPSFLKYLGYWKFTFFVSNLGPEFAPRNPYFYGMKVSLKPSRWFEFGLSHTLLMGGEGAPDVGWWEPVTEMLPIHKWGRNLGKQDIANNAWGFLDFRLTIPPLRGSVLYYDGYIEDSIVRAFSFPDNILNQMAFIAGAYIPRLTHDGDFGLRLEYHHTAPLTYRHSRWISGYTLNRRVIGDALGPAADGVYATLYWRPKPAFMADLRLAYEDYDSSTYRTEANAEGGGDRILKDVPGPHERRYRADGALNWRANRRCGIAGRLGYERISNSNFTVGRSADNLFVQTTLSLYFDEFSSGR